MGSTKEAEVKRFDTSISDAELAEDVSPEEAAERRKPKAREVSAPATTVKADNAPQEPAEELPEEDEGEGFPWLTVLVLLGVGYLVASLLDDAAPSSGTKGSGGSSGTGGGAAGGAA